MRNLSISILARPLTNDNSFNFYTNSAEFNPGQEEQVYQFSSLTINRSIQTSNVSGRIVFTMNQATSSKNVIRGGQIIQIMDGADIKFQGLIVSPQILGLPIGESGQGGLVFIADIYPSIFYLTLSPMIYDPSQASQISSALSVNVNAFIVGQVAQKVNTNYFLSYIISNTDYSNVFQRTIQPSGLPDSVYLMASAGEMKDSVMRNTLDFSNAVIYQQEDGEIIIRSLDSTIQAPFNIDLSNRNLGRDQGGSSTPTVPWLKFKYTDNSATTPAIITNYCMVPNEIGIGSDVQSLLVSVTPNPENYPRIQQLLKSGWFVGGMSNTQLNTNIVSDPALVQIINEYRSYPAKYIIPSEPIGASQDYYAAYQELVTAKQMGQALTAYAGLSITLSLDDPNYPLQNANNVLGSCVNIQNCDMNRGLIAVTCETYDLKGSYIDLNIVPLGSITGSWVN